MRGGVAERISVVNISLDFLWCVIEFQRFRVSVGGVGGFPPRTERVRLWVEGCISSGNGSFDFL